MDVEHYLTDLGISLLIGIAILLIIGSVCKIVELFEKGNK